MNPNDTNQIKLHGFNNLTKTLSFNMFDICYAKSVEDRNAYIEYIDEQYNADRLTTILEHVTQIIGATILNVAKQDYYPRGSSVTILISEQGMIQATPEQQRRSDPLSGASTPEILLAHLDKSHITVHTYPEYHPDGGVATFRADIDVATCGEISPLNALGYMVQSFDSDIMTIDYRVRGFTRKITGEKIFIDHPMTSIQNYIPESVRLNYQMMDVNVYQENIFHTKCKLKTFDLDNYLFGLSQADLHPGEVRMITRKIMREMDEIYNGRNMPWTN
ncbi:MAG: adenosylmethionine decarboxylase [Clostridiaceae bacterium]|jgi:S-adenosylmethionine decarboxylase|nr:adenosylmethionine decarboxylase [Clostridiaceae bacterium]